MDILALILNLVSENFWLILLGIVGILVYRWYRKPRSLMPPGPFALPIVGTLPFLGDEPHKTYTKWHKRYGDVFTVHLGSQPAVIISGIDTVKEAFVKFGDVFGGRPHLWIQEAIKSNKGVVWTEGEHWAKNRKMCVNALNEVGFAKQLTDEKIQDVVRATIKHIEGFDGAPFEPTFVILGTASNVVSNFLFGKKFEFTDKLFQGSLKAIDALVMEGAISEYLEFIPLTRYIPWDFCKVNSILSFYENIHALTFPQIRQHMAKRPDASNKPPEDFIDAYLKTIRDNPPDKDISEQSMQKLLDDLIIAGAESIATTVRWIVLYCILHPHMQKKVQEEIDRVVGRDRLPNMEDRKNMPYTAAFICEGMRHAPIDGVSFPHATTQDIVFKNFHIPKGTWVFYNMWGVHYDPLYYTDPEEFRPERHLDENGQYVIPEAFIPFGIGNRMCVGRALAKKEVFIMTTSFLQHFTLSKPSGTKDPIVKGEIAFSFHPSSYKVVATKR